MKNAYKNTAMQNSKITPLMAMIDRIADAVGKAQLPKVFFWICVMTRDANTEAISHDYGLR